jgi:hypothetical protein
MMNSLIIQVESKKRDEYVRRMINSKIGGIILKKDLFYTLSNYEELGLKILTERWINCKVNKIVSFFQREDNKRRFIQYQIKKKTKMRKVVKDGSKR